MKVFISVPMAGRSDKEIQDDIENAKETLIDNIGEEVWCTFLDNFTSFPPPENASDSIWYLSEAIKKMSFCDAVYFCPGWENARGCLIENEIAINYGLECIYHD